MKFNHIRIAIICLIASLFLSEGALAINSRSLTIFAEPNMALALTKIARLYSQKHDVIVSANFNSAVDLINDIDSGEPADIFISAHPDCIQTLHQKGLVDVYNTVVVAKDSLVLITAKSNELMPETLDKKDLSVDDGLKILNQEKSSLILDYEGNSSGKFGDNLIKKSELFDIQIFRKLAEDRSPILNSIQNDNSGSYYALLLASQVSQNSNYRILATKKDENILYRALVIAGDNMDIAREFLKFLKTEPAKKILKQSGFSDI